MLDFQNEIVFRRVNSLLDQFLKEAGFQDKKSFKNPAADESLIIRFPRDIWALSEDGAIDMVDFQDEELGNI